MPKTVLVTGATGYIAKHLVLQLLEAGHRVVGSARSAERESELRDALTPHLADSALLGNLRVVPLDLTKDDGWAEAMDGVDVLMHTASPFPISQPRDEDDLIRPAVDGALRAVQAAQATGVTRVIMTSSSAAVMSTDLPAGRNTYDERDWTDLAHPSATAYVKSKTMAERAVWDWQAEAETEMHITMINPTFVQGAPLDARFGTSVQLIERLLRGQDPMVPRVGFPCVDVRDVALMHLRAMERPESIGKRYIGVDRFLWLRDMALILKAQHPNRKISTRQAPNPLVRFLSLFDPSIRTILPNLGRRDHISGAAAEADLGLNFRNVEIAIRETGAFLVEHDLV
ncbi:NAD-dependent epimerase/dehydratase family protein [Aestuariivita sp.]|jgi:dihydroflavonol-4-reductase|uniref:NAD-dependent epimerase/dehydratase family protein n=1 Tax=Aestuariivita sp. TaxID=1872407 RepID=UPI00216FFE03|nr:NAD-dependent epimerase/dehydratase family protein [Aestuariivita sp.]MCE8006767.1 NAD-dependent epimerase/dehydratase family protein [Aestuariivita sp.]